MCDAIRSDGVEQRLGNVLLAHDIAERLRAISPSENGVFHAGRFRETADKVSQVQAPDGVRERRSAIVLEGAATASQ